MGVASFRVGRPEISRGAPLNSRNHWFRVKPGDDARMFRDVDIETEGFIARLRRTAHDCEPYGFLVDHRQRPYDVRKIADIAHLANQRTGILMTEARASSLIQSAAEFLAELREAAGRNARVRNKLDVFEQMCSVFGDTPLTDICLMPTLVDDHLETEIARRSGKKGGNPALTVVREDGGGQRIKALSKPLTTPLRGTDKPHSQSHIQSQDQQHDQIQVFEERESLPTARAKMAEGERPLSIRAYATQGFKIAQWTAKQPKQSEAAFEAAFQAEFQITWPMWGEIKRLMELSIPEPCQDGHHVFEGSYCKYCPHISAGEAMG